MLGFSRGERAAILLLLILIAIIILVRYAVPGREEVINKDQLVVADSVKSDSVSFRRHTHTQRTEVINLLRKSTTRFSRIITSSMTPHG